MTKKSVIIFSLIIYLGIILTTSSPFQNNSVLDTHSSFSLNNNIQSIYAEENGDGGGDDDDGGGDDDDGGGDDDDGGGDEDGGGGGDVDGGAEEEGGRG